MMRFERLGNIVDIKKGRKPKLLGTPVQDSVRFLQIDDLRNDDNIKYTSDKTGILAYEDDVLIAWDGANAGTIGFGKSGYIGSTIALLRKKTDSEFNTAFIGKFLQSQFTYLRSKASGATIPHIDRKSLENLRIPVLPLNDQIRIADILSKAESLIRQRNESLRLLDEFLKSTFLEMFGDPLRGENLKLLGDHLRLQHGYAFKSKDFINKGIPVIKIGTINKGYFDIESLSYLGDEFTSGYDQYTIQPGDLLISLTGTVGKDDYANTCFVPEIFRKYLLNQRVAKLVPDERFLQKSYLDFAFKYPGLKKRLIRSNRGIRQANLSSNDIYSIRINIPPISEQIHFTSIVERVEVLRGHYISSLQELNNLHGSLSQRAFQAELYLREETLANAAEPEGLYRKTRK